MIEFQIHGVNIWICKEWRSGSDDFRKNLQLHLDQKLTGKPMCSSISHTLTWGGFALSEKAVGFDMEVSDRVTERVVRRISSDVEMEQAQVLGLSFARLWCAKESAWKAYRLNGVQPPVISSVSIEWVSSEEFLAQTPSLPHNPKMRGQVFSHDDITLSVAVSAGI